MSLYGSCISQQRAAARCTLAHRLNQRPPPGIRLLLVQESSAERVALERVAAQVFGEIGEPPYLPTQQELGDGTPLAGVLIVVFQLDKRRLYMGQTESWGGCVVRPAFRRRQVGEQLLDLLGGGCAHQFGSERMIGGELVNGSARST
jgi:hypothetical protein